MAQIGQAILDRGALVVGVVHPRLPDVPVQPPKYARVTRDTGGGEGGPYRGVPVNERITITHSPSSPWMMLIVGVVIVAVAREIAVSVGLGWPLTIGIAGAVIAFLAAISASSVYRIVIDREAVHAGGPKGTATVARRYIAAIETCEWRARVDGTVAGILVRKGAHRHATFYVRARSVDGQTTELMRLPTREQCWWLQEQLERALALPASA